VFIGTTNDSSYLKDATGNRRFLPVRIGKVDLAGLAGDRDQLFAEALAAWKSDPRESALVLPHALWEEAAARQEERRLVDPWEERLEEFLAKEGAADFYQTTELLEDAIGRDVSRQGQNDWRRVRQVMTRMGWEYGRRRARQPDGNGKGRMVRGYVRPDDSLIN
jgi:putative DNA primase/helicase